MKPLAPSPRDVPMHHPPQRRTAVEVKVGTPQSTEAISEPAFKPVEQVKAKADLFIDAYVPNDRRKVEPPESNDMRGVRSPRTLSPRSGDELSPKSMTSKTSSRSKKILVIDPKTQRKFPLNTDDHSLTDKELLVFHRSDVCGRKKQSSPHHGVFDGFQNDQNSISGHTLSTASALTDAEHYGGKMYGSCHIQTCNMYDETREDELARRGMEGDRDQPTSPSSALSPLAVLTSLASPLNKIQLSSPLSAVQSFFPKVNEDIRCKRIGMVIFPHYFGASGSGPTGYDCGIGVQNGDGDGTLMGLRFKQSPIDFMAHVNFVKRGSVAERLGVEKGDAVTFAISLSNMNSHDGKNIHLAEKLIKRLESVGMRTSYRELFDIFLSTTTNTRPVGIVFRRFKSKPWGGGIVNPVSPKSLSPRSIPNGEGMTITDEFDWSTDFLRALSVKCREYEFERYLPLNKNQIIEKNATVMSFLPRPNSSTVDTKDENEQIISGPADHLSSLLGFANCASPRNCTEEFGETKEHSNNGADAEIEKSFLSNRTLCSLVEQAVGLVFLHRCVDISHTVVDESKPSVKHVRSSCSGFIVVRKTEGEWSAPCFLDVFGSKSPFDYTAETSFESINMIIINKKELAGRLILGNTVKFTANKKQQRVNVLVRDAAIIGNNRGRYSLMEEFFAAVKVSDEKNEAFYSATTPLMGITPKDVLVGEYHIDFAAIVRSVES